MLQKFKVSNFKGFEKELEFDLSDVNGYEFNKSSIKAGTVNNAIVYGHNGVGKSNLALALFDIIGHLTDKQRNDAQYSNYLNAYSSAKEASFYYQFFIRSKVICYEYRKSDYKTLVYERFTIDNIELAYIDREDMSKTIIDFKGAETLHKDIENRQLSILKYIKNNANLAQNDTNATLSAFFAFIEQMLYFRSLLDRTYLGWDVGSKNILEDIVSKGNLKPFERFLNQSGIDCKLVEVMELDRRSIAFDFNGKRLSFMSVASAGTIALAHFFFWYQEFYEKPKVSFLFIDEFDAFYHHSLATLVVEKLKETGVQFILTTHNTSVMSNDLLRPDCYFEMSKGSIRSLAKSTSKELREAHNIEKMYKAGTFNAE